MKVFWVLLHVVQHWGSTQQGGNDEETTKEEWNHPASRRLSDPSWRWFPPHRIIDKGGWFYDKLMREGVKEEIPDMEGQNTFME